MAVSITFLPVRATDILTYAEQLNAMLTGVGIVPTTVGLVAGDVTALTGALTAAQAAHAAVNAANAAGMAATNAFSGTGQALDQLTGQLREMANKARASSVTDDALASIGVFRKGAPTPVAVPTVSPQFTVGNVSTNIVNVNFREAGSANPRKKLASASGVQVAVVDGNVAPAEGEQDSAPNVFVSRSPSALSSAGWPGKVRLYARWITHKGLVGPWSAAVAVTPQ
jgi:hypothetical protein